MGNLPAQLDKETLYAVLSRTFPAQNDFSEGDYSDELNELLTFGIDTREALETLLAKHRETIMTIDSEEPDEDHVRWFTEELGEAYVQERIAGKFWFAYQGLLRIALELEFGDEYRAFANKRDGFDD